jgi:hypothetical protein
MTCAKNGTMDYHISVVEVGALSYSLRQTLVFGNPDDDLDVYRTGVGGHVLMVITICFTLTGNIT